MADEYTENREHLEKMRSDLQENATRFRALLDTYQADPNMPQNLKKAIADQLESLKKHELVKSLDEEDGKGLHALQQRPRAARMDDDLAFSEDVTKDVKITGTHLYRVTGVLFMKKSRGMFGVGKKEMVTLTAVIDHAKRNDFELKVKVKVDAPIERGEDVEGKYVLVLFDGTRGFPQRLKLTVKRKKAEEVKDPAETTSTIPPAAASGATGILEGSPSRPAVPTQEIRPGGKGTRNFVRDNAGQVVEVGRRGWKFLQRGFRWIDVHHDPRRVIGQVLITGCNAWENPDDPNKIWLKIQGRNLTRIKAILLTLNNVYASEGHGERRLPFSIVVKNETEIVGSVDITNAIGGYYHLQLWDDEGSEGAIEDVVLVGSMEESEWKFSLSDEVTKALATVFSFTDQDRKPLSFQKELENLQTGMRAYLPPKDVSPDDEASLKLVRAFLQENDLSRSVDTFVEDLAKFFLAMDMLGQQGILREMRSFQILKERTSRLQKIRVGGWGRDDEDIVALKGVVQDLMLSSFHKGELKEVTENINDDERLRMILRRSDGSLNNLRKNFILVQGLIGNLRQEYERKLKNAIVKFSEEVRERTMYP